MRDKPGHFLAAAFALIFNEDDDLLVLEEHPDRRKYGWDLPGGTLSTAEKPVDALRREVLEETGLELVLESPLCFLKWDWHDSDAPILVAFYVAWVTGRPAVRVSREHIAHRWLSPNDPDGRTLPVPAEMVERLRQLRNPHGRLR